MRSGAGTGDAGDFLPLAASFAHAVQADNESVRQIEYRDRALQVRFEPKAVDSTAKRDALIERLAKGGLAGKFSDSTLTVRRGGGT
jgi:hypothetical protein